MIAALFRQFTGAQLKDYGGAAAAFLDAVLAAVGGAPGPLSLRANPFEEPEREVAPADVESLLADAARRGIEALDLFVRDPRAASPFPFLFRITPALPNDVYKYGDRHYARLPYPPPSPHGYRIDCAISTGLLAQAGAAAQKAVRAFEDLFVGSAAVYGYATFGSPLTVFSGYSDLERERNAPDRAYKGMWCDSLRRTTSGVFAANWLGRDLSLRLPEPARRAVGWVVRELADHRLSLVAEEGLAVREGALRDLADRMADLLPPQEERVPLPEPFRQSLVLQPDELARLGGAAFVREALTPWKLRELKSGWAIVTEEHRFRSEHQVPAECLWPLRPAKLEPWEVDVPSARLGRVSRLVPATEPVRAQIRLRVADEELATGIPIFLAVTGPAKGRKNASQALQDMAAKSGGRFEETPGAPTITKGRIWLAGAGLDEFIELVEAVRSAVGPRSAFLLALGEMSAEEIDMRLKMTGPDRLYMKL